MIGAEVMDRGGGTAASSFRQRSMKVGTATARCVGREEAEHSHRDQQVRAAEERAGLDDFGPEDVRADQHVEHDFAGRLAELGEVAGVVDLAVP